MYFIFQATINCEFYLALADRDASRIAKPGAATAREGPGVTVLSAQPISSSPKAASSIAARSVSSSSASRSQSPVVSDSVKLHAAANRPSDSPRQKSAKASVQADELRRAQAGRSNGKAVNVDSPSSDSPVGSTTDAKDGASFISPVVASRNSDKSDQSRTASKSDPAAINPGSPAIKAAEATHVKKVQLCSACI